MTTHEAGALHSAQRLRPAWLGVPHDVNSLAEQLWSAGVQRSASGALHVHGHSLVDIVAEYPTPLFVLDAEDFVARLLAFKTAFTSAFAPLGTTVSVNYASKAFTCDQVMKWLQQHDIHVDVASEGELRIARAANMAPAHVTVHGNNKSAGLMRAVARGDADTVVIDSLAEVRQWEAALAERETPVTALVRVNVGVEAHTHSYIATAHEDQKFGVALATGEAERTVAAVAASPHLHFAGLHSHIGSQIFVHSGFEVAIERLVEFTASLGEQVTTLNIGGGFGMRYTTAHTPAPVADLAQTLAQAMRTSCDRFGVPVPKVVIEPGRAIAGPSTCTVYTVGTVKPVTLDGGGTRTYVSVDGGMSDNLRPALYGADYSATLANRASSAEPVLCRVVGSHCEAGDILVNDEFLPADIGAGDLIAVPGTGAYCRSMASNYNLMPRPGVLAVAPRKTWLIVRGETLSDVLHWNIQVP